MGTTPQISAAGSGFGQPARPESGQQALASILGAFGQTGQLGGVGPGTSPSSASGFSGGLISSPSTGGLHLQLVVGLLVLRHLEVDLLPLPQPVVDLLLLPQLVVGSAAAGSVALLQLEGDLLPLPQLVVVLQELLLAVDSPVQVVDLEPSTASKEVVASLHLVAVQEGLEDPHLHFSHT